MKVDLIDPGDDRAGIIRIYDFSSAELDRCVGDLKQMASSEIATVELASAFPQSVANALVLTICIDGTSQGVFADPAAKHCFWRLKADQVDDVISFLEPFQTPDPDGTVQWLWGSQSTVGEDGSGIAVLVSRSTNGQW
jgi:hypothetical protein